ncbi:MAG: hypothetical protein AAGI38_03375 [Bacteroidota bacterium]
MNSISQKITSLIVSTLFVFPLYSWGATLQSREEKALPPQETGQKAQKPLQEPIEDMEEEVMEVEMLQEAPPAEEMMMEELPSEEAEYPEPVQDISELNRVSSDLRKEFPKSGHIRIAQRMGITIDDIYYYHNKTIILAIHVITPKVEEKEELKAIQAKLNEVFWDFGYAYVNTFFRANGQCYAISASKRKYGVEQNTIIYDYGDIQKACSEAIASIKAMDTYPFNTQKVYGIFMTPGNLRFDEESNLNDLMLEFIVEEGGQNYTKYLATKANGVYMRNPLPLTWNGTDTFYNSTQGYVIKVDKHGDLLFHSNEISFKEKYADFLMRVE